MSVCIKNSETSVTFDEVISLRDSIKINISLVKNGIVVESEIYLDSESLNELKELICKIED